jgi:hypothetical protein
MVEIDDEIPPLTVHFGRPVKGRDLIAAVNAAADPAFDRDWQPGDSVYAEIEDGRHLVGKSSMYYWRNLLVLPDADSGTGIDPEADYDSADVVVHNADRIMFTVLHSEDQATESVHSFAGGLRRALHGGEQQVRPAAFRDPHAPAAGAVRQGDAPAHTRPGRGTPAAGGKITRLGRE